MLTNHSHKFDFDLVISLWVHASLLDCKYYYLRHMCYSYLIMTFLLVLSFLP